MTRFADIENDFLNSLRAERGLAANTTLAYRRDLDDFYGFCKAKRKPALTASPALVEEYVASLSRANMTPATLNRRLSALREFYKFAVTEKAISASPMLNVESVKRARTLPKFLSFDEVEKMMAAFDDPRGKALLSLAFATGLRASELLGLPVAAVQTSEPYAVIRGKGGRERAVIISPEVKAVMKDYLLIRLNYGKRARDSQWLFPSWGGTGHLTRAGFFKMLKSAARKAGLDEDAVSPHVMRHSFATYMLEKGADLRALQKILGHASISTTEIYTHVAAKALADAVREKHPLAGKKLAEL